MTNGLPRSDGPRKKQVTGEFVDHGTGRSHLYVAKFRTVANDVVWSARVNLGGQWVSLRGGRVVNGGREDHAAKSELVRDSFFDSMHDGELDEAVAAIRAQTSRFRIVKHVLACTIAIAAFCCLWMWVR